MNYKANIYFRIGPRQCGKSELALSTLKASPGTVLLFTADIFRAKELEKKLVTSSGKLINPTNNLILPIGRGAIRGRKIPDVLICDDYLEFKLEDRKKLFYWVNSIHQSVDIYCYTTPKRIYKSSLLNAAEMLKKGFSIKKIKDIKNPDLEEVYYNFITHPLAEIKSIYKPVDLNSIDRSGLPLERILTEFLGVYEQE